jgi:hypothetical protein
MSCWQRSGRRLSASRTARRRSSSSTASSGAAEGSMRSDRVAASTLGSRPRAALTRHDSRLTTTSSQLVSAPGSRSSPRFFRSASHPAWTASSASCVDRPCALATRHNSGVSSSMICPSPSRLPSCAALSSRPSRSRRVRASASRKDSAESDSLMARILLSRRSWRRPRRPWRRPPRDRAGSDRPRDRVRTRRSRRPPAPRRPAARRTTCRSRWRTRT